MDITQNSSPMIKKTVKCMICFDRGIVINEVENIAIPCKCQQEKKRQRLFNSSRITPAFKKKTFDNFNHAGRPAAVVKMSIIAKRYADNFHKLGENNWLVLLGKPGSGKTHLCVAVANQLLDQGIPVIYFPHVEGFAELKNSFNQSHEENLEAKLRELRSVDVLIWDDLFKGRKEPTDWDIVTVFDVLNYRYFNLLPTIISSELTLPRLLKVDQEGGLGSRIAERGGKHLVTIKGGGQEYNYRLKDVDLS